MTNSTDNNSDKFNDEIFAKIAQKGYVGFPDFYKERITPIESFLEDSRLNACKIIGFRKPWGIFAAIAITLFYSAGLIWNYFQIGEAVIWSYIAFMVIIFAWVYAPRDKFESDIKERLYTEIFKFFDGFEYIPKRNDLSHVESCERFGIVPEYSSCEVEDLILGNYQGVYFRFEEWELEQGSGKNRITTFEGVTILFDFNKKFSGQTVVVSNKSGPRNCPNDLEKVELEDPEFEKLFDVYSTDQIEARYLITTAFMERIKSMGEFFGSQDVEIAFYENKLFLMFNDSENLFETESSVSEKINLFSEATQVIKQMNLIFELIDHLKLNQKLGL
jgi:hypothetical protein